MCIPGRPSQVFLKSPADQSGYQCLSVIIIIIIIIIMIAFKGTIQDFLQSPHCDRLVGLVVKASASRAEGPGFESRLRWDFFGVESPVATLPGTWRYRVSTGTGRPGVSIL